MLTLTSSTGLVKESTFAHANMIIFVVIYATMEGRTYYVHSKNYCFKSHFVVLFLLDIWHCYCAYFQARWENYNVLLNNDNCVLCNDSKTCNDLFLVFKYALDSNQMCKEWQLLVFVHSQNISMIKLIKYFVLS